MTSVRLAVIGAGIMGANHARVARSQPGIELVAVVDTDLERARASAGSGGARACATVGEVIGHIDAAVVAVPTPYHLAVATELAAAGVHLLVEKPLAGSVEVADQIIAAAERAGVVLAVGHIEQFNSAVAELPRLLESPLHISASRISPYSARVPDGVIFDLMIHDLEIVLSLAGPDDAVTSVSGVARAVRGATEDLAVVNVGFASGLAATFTTSRLGQQKRRVLEVTQQDSVITADLVRQDVTIQRMTRHEFLSEEGRTYRQSSVVEIPFIDQRGEPLALELQHFAACVRGEATSRVTGAAARRAIELAARADAAVVRT